MLTKGDGGDNIYELSREDPERARKNQETVKEKRFEKILKNFQKSIDKERRV